MCARMCFCSVLGSASYQALKVLLYIQHLPTTNHGTFLNTFEHTYIMEGNVACAVSMCAYCLHNAENVVLLAILPKRNG